MSNMIKPLIATVEFNSCISDVNALLLILYYLYFFHKDMFLLLRTLAVKEFNFYHRNVEISWEFHFKYLV